MTILARYRPGDGYLSFSRSGIAYYRDQAGLWQQAADGVLRDSHYVNGVRTTRLDQTRTNVLFPSDAPSTQTRSLTAATYILWVEGSGSCALSGGPTGTATEGSPVIFSLASTTSVTFTVTGSLTRFQCEGQTATQQFTTGPTSFILTSTGTVTRNRDALTIPFASSVWQDCTVYVDLYELGWTGQQFNRLWHLGATDNSTPHWFVGQSASNINLKGRFENGVTNNNSQDTTDGTDVTAHWELRSRLQTDGNQAHNMTKNGGTEGADRVGSAITPPANWSTPTVLNLGDILGGNGISFSLAGIVVATGQQSLATMRDLLNSQVVVPTADVSDGGWLNELGTGTNLYASVDETGAPDDTDYIKSSTSPVADTVKLALGPHLAPQAGTWTIGVRHKKG